MEISKTTTGQAAAEVVRTVQPILEVKDLEVYYGAIHAIKGLSFYVDPGEIISLIGANGAGKTTILQTISGILSARRGDIIFDGQNLKKVAPHKIVERGLAHVPEGRRMFTGLSVEDNLLMGGYILKSRDDIKAGLDQAFRFFPRLKERRNQKAGTLSGGEQQMLAIGRALMSKPRILLLDEPSMGLSPVLTQEIFSRIREIAVGGTTILLVEQNASMALQLANRAYVLETGRITMTGPAKALLYDERIQTAYLGT